MLFRPITPDDHDDVLRMNAADVEKLAALDSTRLDWLQSLAEHAHVLDIDRQVAAFVITVPPGTSYDSANYAWFGERYDQFLYLDRIVVSDRFRRRGLASHIYDRVEHDAGPHGRVLLEVNLEPANPPSLAFHAVRGYVEVGRHARPGKVTQMLEKLVP